MSTNRRSSTGIELFGYVRHDPKESWLANLLIWQPWWPSRAIFKRNDLRSTCTIVATDPKYLKKKWTCSVKTSLQILFFVILLLQKKKLWIAEFFRHTTSVQTTLLVMLPSLIIVKNKSGSTSRLLLDYSGHAITGHVRPLFGHFKLLEVKYNKKREDSEFGTAHSLDRERRKTFVLIIR